MRIAIIYVVLLSMLVVISACSKTTISETLTTDDDDTLDNTGTDDISVDNPNDIGNLDNLSVSEESP